MEVQHSGESPVLLPNLQILLWLSRGTAASVGDYQALQQLSAFQRVNSSLGWRGFVSTLNRITALQGEGFWLFVYVFIYSKQESYT